MNHRSPYLTTAGAAALLMSLAACGGGGSSSSNAARVADIATSYTVGGTVSGLHGLTLTLVDNGSDTTSITGDGSFTFPTPLANGNAYSISTKNPLWTTCVVTNGSGSASTNVSNVSVTCKPLLGAISTLTTRSSAFPVGVSSSTFVPAKTAVDTSGNVYVADSGNNTVEKISANGTITALVTTSSAFPSGLVNSSFTPDGVAVDANANVYVADTGNHAIEKISASGTITTLATRSSSFPSGAVGADFQPAGIAVDTSGNVYVSDNGGGNQAVEKISASGAITALVTKSSNFPSNITGGANFAPGALAVDSSGNVYVADTGNGVLEKASTNGSITLLGSQSTTLFAIGLVGYTFSGVAVDVDGNVYAADQALGEIYKICPDGSTISISSLANTYSTFPSGLSAAKFGPTGVAVDASGNVYVADGGNEAVEKLVPIL